MRRIMGRRIMGGRIMGGAPARKGRRGIIGVAGN
jgi:hypothetical protein